MATVNPVKKLRATASENAAQTLEIGTIVYLTDTKQVAIHDGSTSGGTVFEELSGLAQTGSNSNGTYIKFADGTMICRGEKAHYDAGTGAQTVTFPAEFDVAPHVMFMQKFSGSQYLYKAGLIPGVTATTARVYWGGNGDPNIDTVFMAIGTWS